MKSVIRLCLVPSRSAESCSLSGNLHIICEGKGTQSIQISVTLFVYLFVRLVLLSFFQNIMSRKSLCCEYNVLRHLHVLLY